MRNYDRSGVYSCVSCNLVAPYHLMKIQATILLLLLSGCGIIGRGPHLIPDQTSCNYKYYFFDKTGRKGTIIRVYQRCKKGDMTYFFDRDSTVWKANGIPRKRTFAFRLVYDTTYEFKLTNAELQLFKEITTKADSLSIHNFENLKIATGFIKIMANKN